MVTAGKHVDNNWAIARQLLGKQSLAATDTRGTVELLFDYNKGNNVFYVVRFEMLLGWSVEFQGLRELT
jgi:hypothetical protein